MSPAPSVPPARLSADQMALVVPDLYGFDSRRNRAIPALLAHVAALEAELILLREIARAAKRERICDSYDRCPNDPQCGETLDVLLAAWRDPDGGES